MNEQKCKHGFFPTFLIIIITAVLVGGGVYIWQQKNINQTETPTIQPTETTNTEKTESNEEKTPLSFAHINEYAEYFLKGDNVENYKAEKPSDYERYSTTEDNSPVDWGTQKSVYALINKTEFDSAENREDPIKFYIEIVESESESNYYGPFDGSVMTFE